MLRVVEHEFESENVSCPSPRWLSHLQRARAIRRPQLLPLMDCFLKLTWPTSIHSLYLHIITLLQCVQYICAKGELYIHVGICGNLLTFFSWAICSVKTFPIWIRQPDQRASLVIKGSSLTKLRLRENVCKLWGFPFSTHTFSILSLK